MNDKENEKDTTSEEEPKIVVDDDWKVQAQAEKEKLADTEKDKPATGAERGEAHRPLRELPPPNFATLISALLTQVLLSLGGMEDPKTKKRYVDLELAKHHIDMLSVIEEKTKGNLTDEDKKLLDNALYEARMQYVQIAQAATRVGQ